MPNSILIILTLAFAFSVLPAKSSDDDTNSKIDRFAKAYEETKSADQKRALCIKAMDDGLLRKYDSITVVDRMFHTHYASYFIAKDEDGGCAVIHFTPQHFDGYNQELYVGWYLAVKYDQDRKIKDFFLSNQNDK